MRVWVKFEELTTQEILYARYRYELGLPAKVIMDEMNIKKSCFYLLKQRTEEKLEKQRRRYILAGHSIK